MRTFVLFHIVLSRERFATGGAVDVLFTSVLFAMTCSVAGGGESVGAGECFGVWAGVFLFGSWGFVVGG